MLSCFGRERLNRLSTLPDEMRVSVQLNQNANSRWMGSMALVPSIIDEVKVPMVEEPSMIPPAPVAIIPKRVTLANMIDKLFGKVSSLFATMETSPTFSSLCS